MDYRFGWILMYWVGMYSDDLWVGVDSEGLGWDGFGLYGLEQDIQIELDVSIAKAAKLGF